MVSAAAADALQPVPVLALSGALGKAEPAPSQEVLEQTGTAEPGDEAFIVRVGGTDDPLERNYFLLRRSDLRGGGWEEGAFGERLLLVELEGVNLTIVRRAEPGWEMPHSGA